VQRVTVEASRNLRGHNGKVRSVCWSADDTMLVSCGMDGAAYEWSLKDFKRVGESVLKSCNYTCAGTHFTCITSTKVRVLTRQGCAVCTPDGKTTFAVGTDKKVRSLYLLYGHKSANTDAATAAADKGNRREQPGRLRHRQGA
jgi:WD40 repeat protein